MTHEDLLALIAEISQEPGHPFCPACMQDSYKLLAVECERLMDKIKILRRAALKIVGGFDYEHDGWMQPDAMDLKNLQNACYALDQESP